MTDWADERAREWLRQEGLEQYHDKPRLVSLAALLREVAEKSDRLAEAWKEKAQVAMRKGDGKVEVDLLDYYAFIKWKNEQADD